MSTWTRETLTDLAGTERAELFVVPRPLVITPLMHRPSQGGISRQLPCFNTVVYYTIHEDQSEDSVIV